MKIKVLIDFSTHERCYSVGEEPEMDEAQAKRVIELGLAESLEAAEAVETATMAAGEEQAVPRHGRKK